MKKEIFFCKHIEENICESLILHILTRNIYENNKLCFPCKRHIFTLKRENMSRYTYICSSHARLF